MDGEVVAKWVVEFLSPPDGGNSTTGRAGPTGEVSPPPAPRSDPD
jgi:hypothetical protein